MNKVNFSLATIMMSLILNPTALIGQDVQYYYTKAKDAYEQKAYDEYYNNLVEAYKLHPYHQGILYRLGIASALTNHKDQSIDALTKAIRIDANFELNVPDLKSLYDLPEYGELLRIQKDIKTPIITSDTAFVLNDKGSHIESIAFDPKTRHFFLGSIHKRKIFIRNEAGVTTDFTKSGDFGLCAVFGLQVDEAKRILWACSSPMPEMENYDSTLHAAVYKFNIDTGQLLAKYESQDTTHSVFGDLTINSIGQVFVSDSRGNMIFIVDESTKRLEPFFTSKEFWNIQGISFSLNDQYLFISDYIKGPYKLEIATKNLVKLESGSAQSLKGIDGLLVYENSLVAIQNGVSPLRVTQYYLNEEQTKITDFRILDRGHPAFNEPTIGCIFGTQFFYVANSLWGAYDENFQIKSELSQDAVILKTDLKK